MAAPSAFEIADMERELQRMSNLPLPDLNDLDGDDFNGSRSTNNNNSVGLASMLKGALSNIRHVEPNNNNNNINDNDAKKDDFAELLSGVLMSRRAAAPMAATAAFADEDYDEEDDDWDDDNKNNKNNNNSSNLDDFLGELSANPMYCQAPLAADSAFGIFD